MTEVAAFAAWLGGALIVLADGRRGLALGLTVMTVGLAGLALAAGQPFGATAMLAGGAVASVLRLRSGPDAWGLMQPGSTPRIILTVAVGLVALWLAASVSSGDGAPLRFAVLATMVMTAARILQGGDRAVCLTAASGLAIALGAGTGITSGASGPVPYLIAALIAAGISMLPQVEPHGA